MLFMMYGSSVFSSVFAITRALILNVSFNDFPNFSMVEGKILGLTRDRQFLGAKMETFGHYQRSFCDLGCVVDVVGVAKLNSLHFYLLI